MLKGDRVLAVVKERGDKGQGEGDVGKEQGYLPWRDKGLPLEREETDWHLGKWWS